MFGGGGFGGFGSANKQQPSLFGQPNPTPTATTFGSFGQPAQQSFGQPATGGFGQQQAATFGQPANTFGQPGSTFGQQASTFGQPATTFGQPAANTFGQPATSSFGQPPTSSFGTGFGAGGFGGSSQQTSQTANNGTGNPAYAVTLEREGQTMSTNANYQSITAMAAYKNWSIEVSHFLFHL
jgi:hypothetical protein